MQRDTTGSELGNFFGIRVDARDLVSDVGKPGSGWQTDVSGTNDDETFWATQTSVCRPRVHGKSLTMVRACDENFAPTSRCRWVNSRTSVGGASR